MTLEDNTRDWMTPKEVAVKLEVTARAVVNWIQRKKLRCVKVGGRYRVPPDAVTDFLKQRN
jgi:excisionase family DNA binding protein